MPTTSLSSRTENNTPKIGTRFIKVMAELEDNLRNPKLYNKKAITEQKTPRYNKVRNDLISGVCQLDFSIKANGINVMAPAKV